MKSVSNVRTTCVPMDHLTAELIASPFSSSSGFQGAVTSLDSSLKSRDTKSLWRETERILLQRFPNISIDELVARRDRAWFK